MTSPDPAHIDAIRRLLWTPVQTDVGPRSMYFDEQADALLDSTDPAVHAAMLDALTRHGVLRRDVDDGWVWYEGDHEEVTP